MLSRVKKTGPLPPTKIDIKDIAPMLDILQALRYNYYCAKRAVVPNRVYDEAKEEEMEYGGGSPILSQPASDRPTDYPSHIRCLAFYMHYKYEMKQPVPWQNGLPFDFFPHKPKASR